VGKAIVWLRAPVGGFGPIAASFGNVKVGERFGLKTRGGGTPASFNQWLSLTVAK